ncbi:hypothetical protein [Variovorax paradoxus]|uniref:hypothetical protein n=1 Tax=Variovorax paradoxus TaxID=34073 RepID=UPI0012D4155A|nr:hypothetical protein [Variovorax paradoxus]
MTAYSINGYGVAVSLRSSKTILVEGVSDKRLLSRLMLQRQLTGNVAMNCCLDEVAIVSDDPMLAGLGAKQKIQIIANMVGDQEGQFNWLVDREWDGVDLEAEPMSTPLVEPMPWGKKTKGHSIENYWFRSHVLVDYLKMFYGDQLPAAYFLNLHDRFKSMLQLAAAFSFAAKRLAIIGRCQGAITSGDAEWNGHNYLLKSTINTTLLLRNVPTDVAAESNSELQGSRLQTAPIDALQWLCHGHLGEEVVRSCAANLAAEMGAQAATVEAIERGSRAEKFAHHSNSVVELEQCQIEPLWDLVAWAEA